MRKSLSVRGVFVIFLLSTLILPLGFFSTVQAEQLRFATSYKLSPIYATLLAALEKRGVWKQNGIDAKTMSFRGGRRMFQAITAGSLDMATADTIGTVRAAFAGAPFKIVADYAGGSYFGVYVPGNSPLQKATDLKGKKIGVSRAGGSTHAIGRLLAKALGISAEVKFISIAGFSARIASLKSGTIDGSIHGTLSTAELVPKGVVRLLVSTADYLPKNWSFHVVVTRNVFLKRDPALVKRAVSAVIKAIEEARSHRTWVKEGLKKELHFSEGAAQYVSGKIFPKPGTRVRLEGLAVVRDFLLEYGLTKKERVLPLKQIVAPEFVE